jgi:hypothetical protein
MTALKKEKIIAQVMTNVLLHVIKLFKKLKIILRERKLCPNQRKSFLVC